MDQKREKFEDLREQMQDVIFGEIGNFYREDFPEDKLVQGGEEETIGEYAKVDVFEVPL